MKSTNVASGPPPSGLPRCPLCGAEAKWPDAKRCWLCNENMSAPANELGVPDIRLPTPRGDAGGFALAGILGVLLILGMSIETPGLLLLLLVIATPALIRAVMGMTSQPQNLTGWRKAFVVFDLFMSSLGIVVMVGVAAAAAFFATCFAVCMGGLAVHEVSQKGGSGDWMFVPSIGAGIAVAGLVAILLFIRLWPRRR